VLHHQYRQIVLRSAVAAEIFHGAQDRKQHCPRAVFPAARRGGNEPVDSEFGSMGVGALDKAVGIPDERFARAEGKSSARKFRPGQGAEERAAFTQPVRPAVRIEEQPSGWPAFE
jgi:hypothetical protein